MVACLQGQFTACVLYMYLAVYSLVSVTIGLFQTFAPIHQCSYRENETTNVIPTENAITLSDTVTVATRF